MSKKKVVKKKSKNEFPGVIAKPLHGKKIVLAETAPSIHFNAGAKEGHAEGYATGKSDGLYLGIVGTFAAMLVVLIVAAGIHQYWG